MAMKRPTSPLPFPVRRLLRKLGSDIRDARRRRSLPAAIMAERASVTRLTLHRLERGEPGVAMGTYATVLFILGMADRLADLADVTHDITGLALEDEHLPKRIRRARAPSEKPVSAPRTGRP